MSLGSHEKDVQQTESAKKKRRDATKNDQKQVETQKVSQKDHNDMDENQYEKQLIAASAADVLAKLDDDRYKDKKSKKERRKSGARSLPGEPAHDVEEVPAIKKKDKDRNTTDSGGVQVPSSVPENRDGKKKKSSKRKHADCDPDEAPVSAATIETDQPPKKRSKIVNPKKDELLSEQALKALAYAYSQYRHPEKWKFNKARQNWITRNVWSADMIPDQHLPLVTWYLKSIKGGVRDALIEKCQSHAQLSSQPQFESKPTTTESVPIQTESTAAPLFGLTPEALKRPSGNAAETKVSRAQILLEALQAP